MPTLYLMHEMGTQAVVTLRAEDAEAFKARHFKGAQSLNIRGGVC